MAQRTRKRTQRSVEALSQCVQAAWSGPNYVRIEGKSKEGGEYLEKEPSGEEQPSKGVCMIHVLGFKASSIFESDLRVI